MLTLPVLFVLREERARPLLDALEQAQVPARGAPPSEAADAVNSGWAELVVCERVPGWQALLARIEGAGGAAVLWGEAPRAEESKGIVPAQVEAVQALPALLPALHRAQARRLARNALGSGGELQDSVESVERVSRFAQSIATQLALPDVIREAMARTRDLCDADGASLLLVDSATGELCFDQVAGGAGSAIERVRLQPGEGIAGKVALSARSQLVRDVGGSPDFSRGLDEATGFRTGSIIAVPLLLSGDVVGVLEAVRGADRAPFEPGHLRWLERLAPHVSIAVHNAQITASLREAQAQVLLANTHLEQKVRERTAQIALAERKLRESERLAALGQLASGAAHEINNPLGFVISNLRSLQTNLQELAGADPEQLRTLRSEGLEMVAESLDGAGRVADIVRGLRELSRLQVERAEVATVDDSVSRAVRAEFAAAASAVRLELQARGRARVSPLHLDQALGHVLRNARQAVRAGQAVTVRSRDEAHSVLLEVQDEGCGIPPEHLHRVFEPFFTTRGVRGGIGLGLTAAYGIVQRNGGSIELRSAPGEGTTVSIRLPRVGGEEPRALDA